MLLCTPKLSFPTHSFIACSIASLKNKHCMLYFRNAFSHPLPSTIKSPMLLYIKFYPPLNL